MKRALLTAITAAIVIACVPLGAAAASAMTSVVARHVSGNRATMHRSRHRRHRHRRLHHRRSHRTGSSPARQGSRGISVGSAPASTSSTAVDPTLLAAVLQTPCPNTELTPTEGNREVVAQATLCLIDQERARHGEAPLLLDAHLARAAQDHGAEMIGEDYFAHISPAGVTPLERIRATGYFPSPQDGYAIGENIAWGTFELSTPRAIVAAWIASPEHLANILDGEYLETAISVVPAVPASLAHGQQGALYTQEFGTIFP